MVLAIKANQKRTSSIAYLISNLKTFLFYAAPVLLDFSCFLFDGLVKFKIEW